MLVVAGLSSLLCQSDSPVVPGGISQSRGSQEANHNAGEVGLDVIPGHSFPTGETVG